MKRVYRLIVAVAAPLVAFPVFAGDSTTLGTHGSWTSYVYKEGANKVCYMTSSPTRSEGKYAKRDPVFINVTHRPASKSFGVVSVIAGYVYKDGDAATLEVGDKAFSLNARGELAWAKGEDDKAIVAAMKAGSDVAVKGQSERGTKTVDHFSLAGFAAALSAIGKACGAR
ncbi:MAG: hypothetical protein HQL33_06425 [Alphaproteobacteria bacterium]|nr:hypothetical protein [Alphaproteobacteria bacterium]MBF0129609.1 hypothetical protein [Alphaproteobacteria bacterium]